MEKRSLLIMTRVPSSGAARYARARQTRVIVETFYVNPTAKMTTYERCLESGDIASDTVHNSDRKFPCSLHLDR